MRRIGLSFICVLALVMVGTQAPGEAASGTSRTCGPSWRRAPIPDVGGATALSTISGTRAWAVSEKGHITKWDGSSWALTASPGAATLYDVSSVGPSDAWAVGTESARPTLPYAEHWNGSSWATVAVPQPNDPSENGYRLNTVEGTSSSDVWAAGAFTYRGGTAPVFMHWNGAAWTAITPGETGQLLAMDARAADDIWAVGENDLHRTQIAHWNGSEWTFSSGDFPGQLVGVRVLGPSNVWAVGNTGTPYQYAAAETLVVHWDGTSWTRVASPSPGEVNLLSGIGGFGPRDLWAVGFSYTSAGGEIPLRVHWNGSRWSYAPGPSYSASQLYVPARDRLNDVVQLGGRWLAVGEANESLAEDLCPQRVGDSGFTPPAPWSFLNPPRRETTVWRFPTTNTGSHSVSDASGLGLFDSGVRAPGSSFTHSFFAAATYPLVDDATGNRGQARVPVWVNPQAGPASGSFSVVWASETAPAGFIYDVRIERPGSGEFVPWRSGTTAAGAAFRPDAGAGMYTFISRLRQTSTGRATPYSPWRSIHVG